MKPIMHLWIIWYGFVIGKFLATSLAIVQIASYLTFRIYKVNIKSYGYKSILQYRFGIDIINSIFMWDLLFQQYEKKIVFLRILSKGDKTWISYGNVFKKCSFFKKNRPNIAKSGLHRRTFLVMCTAVKVFFSRWSTNSDKYGDQFDHLKVLIAKIACPVNLK